jgi:hypothetical protein
VPIASAETLRPELPSCRYSIARSLPDALMVGASH